VPTLDGFDKTLWASDKNGCKGERLHFKTTLKAQSKKLEALSETEIVSLLGNPDSRELHTHNQKFYYYLISPSPDCGGLDSAASRLVIRFNAMGLAKNINIED
jgi:hypothetical protein